MRRCLPPRFAPPGLLGLMALMALASLVAGPTALAQAPPDPGLRVLVAGAVRQPGERELPVGARFSDAVLAAMPEPWAYVLGAAVLRREAAVVQARAKAGLLYDLQTLQTRGRTDAGVAAVAARLQAWIRTLPVTGRVPNRLEPRLLEIELDDNKPLADGDRFVYPLRPDTVRIVGALARDCELAHVPLRDAADYLRDCPPAASAARDWLYAIQPDGHVERLGIAAWNRSPRHALAPGAWLYVPLSERRLRQFDQQFSQQFNQELAAFIATQPLPMPEGAP